MRVTVQDRLLRRELGDGSSYSGVKGIYGDRAWVNDLDIVNELGGHSGCVNALSWSKSGRLLASGSDDQHLNIHSYQPDSSTPPFALTTTVATGHRANIFSVKFMPHSNDQTLVTCAGDGEVRVFDIEYSGRSSIPLTNPNMAYLREQAVQGRQRFNNFYQGVRYLSDGDTNARVYRSHGDRVKRIVTESSPYLFLSCSEDGEVRQWDLRLPSSAYPAPRSGRSFRRDHQQDSNVPPPLISYKRYHLDLNTISCSASQPHYIALGGAHLHCFLHDRRMLGRDTVAESGKLARASSTNGFSEHDDNALAEATRCVRRFAPLGQDKMRRTDNGHITACKISDANPNELIASWSGDHIYSFDLVKTSDARDAVRTESRGTGKGKSKGKTNESKDRKRKRKTETSTASAEGARRGGSQPRLSSQEATNGEDLALRVRYENGQSEDVPMDTSSIPATTVTSPEEVTEYPPPVSQRRSRLIAKNVVKVWNLMFSLKPSTRDLDGGELDLASHTPLFSSILELATTYLPRIDKIIRIWRYPVNPHPDEIRLQKTLRSGRDSFRRFIQAAGTLARVMIGQTENGGAQESSALRLFDQIQPATSDGPIYNTSEVFRYDFLRAILLWLDGGPQALLQGFKRPPDQRNDNPRFPVPDDAQHAGIDDFIIPYLLRLAGAHPVPNVDASRFERDELRQTFQSETAAVVAFSHAIKMPLEDLSRAVVSASSSADGTGMSIEAQDRKTALKFWAFKVGRGLLMKAVEGINFASVDRAFGGLGTSGIANEGRVQEDIYPNESGSSSRELGQITVYESGHVEAVMGSLENVGYQSSNRRTYQFEPPDWSNSTREGTMSASSEEDVIRLGDLHDELADHMVHDDEEGDEGEEEDDEGDDGGDDDDDEDITAEERRFVFQSASDRGKLRESVQAHVPCSAHSRKYQGHCNVKTVKDVSFFGLQDEYVVSGSDCGHLFIWDKKTSQLLNILKGDGEVVNVVEGHPYEPMLAVSGIDHTIKIFSPDVRSQQDARNGINLSTSSNDSTGHSSIMLGRRRRPPTQEAATNEDGNDNDTRPRKGGLASRKRMKDSYRIVSQNDVERQGGMQDAFITASTPGTTQEELDARYDAVLARFIPQMRLGGHGSAALDEWGRTPRRSRR
ncbi:MAG: hypothetical protein Q9187_004193 [Circinaria calcarea]